MAKKKITQLDLFSGIGGFHLGFEKAGFKVKSYFSEIDKHAIAVYRHQFKDAEYVGSVIDIDGNKLPRIDLITFGSPCQDFSLAGKRKGMGGERSSLVLEAIRLIDECRPSVFVWENVKGTFSSNNGADFAAILQAFANIGGYRLEWQLLNTSWVLPQNRERVYLVGYSTKPGRNWRGVFPIGRSGKQNIQLRSEAYEVGDYRSDEGWRPRKDGNSPTLAARAREDGSGQPLLKVKSDTKQGYEDIEIGDIRYDEGGFRPRKNGIAPALVGSNDKSGTPNCSILKNNSTYRIRRLTPIECERLQGFPDNHTEYGIYDGEVKKMSNTQRYKQCGNAVTVDIVALVAEAVKPLFK